MEEQGVKCTHGKVDLDIIKEVKESVSIPVIGNGDISDEKSAEEMFKYTNCDAIMIGRGAIGNPWVFNQIETYLKTGEKIPKPTIKERIKTMISQLVMTIEDKGERTAIREMRKQIHYYIKGIPNIAELRNEINHIENAEKLIEKFKNLL